MALLAIVVGSEAMAQTCRGVVPIGRNGARGIAGTAVQLNGSIAVYSGQIGGGTDTALGPNHVRDPWVWLFTDDLGRFWVRKSGRAQFGRELRASLGPLASAWDHLDTIEDFEPLGRYFVDITVKDRVRWMSHADELASFLIASMEQGMALAPAIDSVLLRYRKV